MVGERDHVGFFGAYAIRNCHGIEDVRRAVGAIEKMFLEGSALGRLEIVENVCLGCHRFLCFVMCHVSVPLPSLSWVVTVWPDPFHRHRAAPLSAPSPKLRGISPWLDGAGRGDSF